MADFTVAIDWLESKTDPWFGYASPARIAEGYASHDVVGVLRPDDERLPEYVRDYAQYLNDQAIDDAGGMASVDLAQAPGIDALADSHQGKRVLGYQYWLDRDSDGMSGAQKTGDCVSWGLRGAVDIRRSLIAIRTATKSLLMQGYGRNEPTFRSDVMAEASRYYERAATAVYYSGRGHTGQGASPVGLSQWACKTPICLELDYGNGYDFRNYGDYYRKGMGWGRSGAPKQLLDILREKHGDAGAKTYKVSRDAEASLDMMVAGYFPHNGSGMGVASTGDPLSRISGSWNHDMLVCGFDATEWCIEKFGDVVVFWDQSWGRWNRVSNIPAEWGKWGEGMFALKLRDCRRYLEGGGCCHMIETNGIKVDDPMPWDDPWFPYEPTN